MKLNKCIICEKDFYTKTVNGKQPIRRNRYRKRGSLTCSANCGKIYQRVSHYLQYQLKEDSQSKPKTKQ